MRTFAAKARKPAAFRPLVSRAPPGLALRPKLALGRPGDRYEQEADRVATQVMRMPAPGVNAPPASPAAALGGGKPLPEATRAFFEPRFGHSFADVRVFADGRAARSAKTFNARAYTLGRDVVFGDGQYAPGTQAGKSLLAHELTHVAQQANTGPVASPRGSGAVSIHNQIAHGTIAGDWIIDNPNRRLSPKGKMDKDLIAGAFSEICSLSTLSGNRIKIATGPPVPNSIEGCKCLRDIENDLASPLPSRFLKGTPHVKLNEHGWSYSTPRGSPPIAAPRHPDGPLNWGYWTGGQTRHVKPFWQTVAHEVCGHIASLVRTKGVHSGGRRGNPAGHNMAIINENSIAGEHGVISSEQRGLDFDPIKKEPLSGHRGESFLQATVSGFSTGSAQLPSSSTNAVEEVAKTVKTLSESRLNLNFYVQIEGFAYADEGGVKMAGKRAAKIRTALEAELKAQSIPLDIALGRSRFFQNLAGVVRGTSVAPDSLSKKRANIYLFHNKMSAGP